MCGGEASIRIEQADNGFVVDAYTPGNGDKPGVHSRKVATDPDKALELARPHMRKMGKKRKMHGHGPETPSVAYGKSPEKKGRKKAQSKR